MRVIAIIHYQTMTNTLSVKDKSRDIDQMYLLNLERIKN